MFTFIKTIDDIKKQISNSPIFYNRFFKIADKEFWLQYNHMSFRKTCHYEIGGIVMGCAAVQLIKKENDNLYSVYKYNGSLIIDRHLENNVIDDTIKNIISLEEQIKEYFEI